MEGIFLLQDKFFESPFWVDGVFSKKGDSTENNLGEILEVQLLMKMYF
jgi:hypothetical protein